MIIHFNGVTYIQRTGCSGNGRVLSTRSGGIAVADTSIAAEVASISTNLAYDR